VTSAQLTSKPAHSAETFAGLLEAIRESVIYTDLEGRICYWNEGATRIFGYSAEEMLGQTPALLYPKENPERLAADLQEVMKGRDYSGEWLGRRKDGSEVWVDITTTLVRDSRGGPRGFLGVAKDITERKRAEQELDRVRAELRLIADAAPAYIAHCDAERRYRFVNQAYATRFGLTPQQVVGRHIWEVVGREAYESVREYLDQVLAGNPVEFEVEVPFEELGRHYMHCAYAPEQATDGSVIGLIAVVTDVTAQRVTELQLRRLDRLETVGRLAGGVAHEANNQMSVVLGMVSFVLRNAGLSPEIRRDLNHVRQAAERTAAVSQQLLTFSRRQITRPRVLDLNTVVGGFEPVLRRTLGDDVTLELNLVDGLGPIRADKSQLEQLLLNLVLNSRDAMPEGGLIEIATRDAWLEQDFGRDRGIEVAPGRYVRLQVRDTGQGMDQRTLSHLFEPFFTTKEVGRGTGLGLATVYGIVKQHNGYVFVDSALGQGTTFEVYFPATEGRADGRSDGLAVGQ
jgi:PAS domain S-box-containing protein